jgi:hypothetical protein
VIRGRKEFTNVDPFSKGVPSFKGHRVLCANDAIKSGRWVQALEKYATEFSSTLEMKAASFSEMQVPVY